MAAPIRYATFRSAQFSSRFLLNRGRDFNNTQLIGKRCFTQFNGSGLGQNGNQKFVKSAISLSGLVCGAYIANRWIGTGEFRQQGLVSTQAKQRGQTWTGTGCADEPDQPINRKPRVLSTEDATSLNLTLYQYQVCPFCSKLRAFLDYFDVPYTIVEVDPVFRGEIKFSNYRKVPILIQRSNGKEDIQLNDSSVIISILTSFMVTDEKDLSKLLSYYPKLTYTDEKGKEISEFTNRYNVMLQDTPGLTKTEKEEMKWRKWVDNVLVHNLPPNIYRTPAEALQAFEYISEKGHFNSFQKFMIKYTGAAGMYVIAMKLKSKYHIKDDVRESLYDAANDWMDVVGNKKFMGGAKPNLADLSVYGVLSSIEGLDAFNDMCINTPIGPWYLRVKRAVNTHAGAAV